MENRQPPTNKPYDEKKNQDNNKEGSNFQNNTYPNNRYPNREGGQDRFQNRNPREGGDRPPNREGGGGERPFQPRDNRSNFQPRTGQDNRDPRDNRSGQNNRDNRSQNNFRPNTGGRPFQKTGGDRPFQPRGKFQPGSKPFSKTDFREDNIKIVSEKQITDGKHKGKYLENSVAAKAEPSPRRVREAVMKILIRKIRAGRILDLCAGSGTIGIEAISRGAITATFVERSAKMCGFIKKNLEKLGIKTGHGEIVEMEAMPFLKKIAKRRRFYDLIYLDPTFQDNFDEIFAVLSRGAGMTTSSVLVVEHPSKMFLPEKSGVLRRFRVVLQGEKAASFYERV